MATEEELGSDLGGGPGDIDSRLSRVVGRRCLLQALSDRLSTQRGGLWYAPAYGDDIRRFIGASVRQRLIEQAVEAECMQDERVLDARATVAESDDDVLRTSRISLDIVIQDAEGPFAATLTVDQVTVSFLMKEAV